MDRLSDHPAIVIVGVICAVIGAISAIIYIYDYGRKEAWWGGRNAKKSHYRTVFAIILIILAIWQREWIYDYAEEAGLWEILATTTNFSQAFPTTAQEHLDRGLSYGPKEYDRQIEAYTHAIEIDPNFAMAYHNRGVAYDNKGEYDLAIADLNEAIRLVPNFTRAYNSRGVAYYHKGEYDLAIADYTHAIELDPNFAAAHNNRGVIYEQKGEYDLAIADYTRAIELDPNFALAFHNRGYVYELRGEYDLALADYDRALEIDPNHTNARIKRNNLLAKMGQ